MQLMQPKTMEFSMQTTQAEGSRLGDCHPGHLGSRRDLDEVAAELTMHACFYQHQRPLHEIPYTTYINIAVAIDCFCI